MIIDFLPVLCIVLAVLIVFISVFSEVSLFGKCVYYRSFNQRGGTTIGVRSGSDREDSPMENLLSSVMFRIVCFQGYFVRAKFAPPRIRGAA